MAFWTAAGAIALGMFGADILNYGFRNLVAWYIYKQIEKQRKVMTLPSRGAKPYVDYEDMGTPPITH